MQKKYFILILLAIFQLQAYSQQRSCATMEVYNNSLNSNPKFKAKQQTLELKTQDYNNMQLLMSSSSSTYTIPVVIHVLYNSSEENISDEQIFSQMTSVNEDFRALNLDLSSLPSVFENVVADINIDFCLAQLDPDGNPTTGINRVFTNTTNFSYNDDMKFNSSGGVDAWNSSNYLNIWVCELDEILGYAQFPGDDPTTDGVVVDNNAFGSVGTASEPYNLGRTLTHEIGHWLNLRHIWGDSYCGDDFVDDTPTHQEANYACPDFPHQSCSNGPNGDMFMNYMDYTEDACMYMFTTGQKNRMTSALLNSRSSLLSSNACNINTILGCTDTLASNYNENATTEDSTCIYECSGTEINFEITTDCFPEETSWSIYDSNQNLVIGNNAGDYSSSPQTTLNELICLIDGCYTLTINDLYGDGLYGSQWGNCNSDGNYILLNDDGTILVEMTETNFGYSIDHPFCVTSEIEGCNDPAATNYNPNATFDDGSCDYCSNFEAVLINSNDVTEYLGNNGSIEATGQGGSGNYSLSVYDEYQIAQNPFELSAGDYTAIVTDLTFNCSEQIIFTINQAENPCHETPSGLFTDNIIHNRINFNWSTPNTLPSHYMIRYKVSGSNYWTVLTAGTVNSTAYNGTTRTRYFMEPSTSYLWSIRTRTLDEEGNIICQSNWSANSSYTTLPICPNLENLSVETEANWATFTADEPSTNYSIWQSKGKIRELSTNFYRYVNGDSNISALKGNFDANTDYEWHTKAWCSANLDANGNPDVMYHSGWGHFSAFTTKEACDAQVTNLSTSTNNNSNAIIMSWNSPDETPDHYFLELTNETTGQVFQWNNIAGNSTSKTKYGQTLGHQFSWKIRSACGANGTSWATSFTSPVYYTLGGQRMLDSSIYDLNLYPNPTEGNVNISYYVKDKQEIEIIVSNAIGKVVYRENKVIVGDFSEKINLSNQAKGIYLIQLNTATKSIQNKISLQ